MESVRFVVIDVETTGVSYTKGDRIIQLAYVVIENKKVIDRYSTYLNPNREIPPFIQSLTNINDELVKNAPTFGEIVPKLLKALDGAFFVAHNVDFDLNFINDEIVGTGYDPFNGPVIDTVELSRIAFPTSDGFKLSQLSESFSVDHNEPHRADSDAEATAQLLLEIIRKLSSLPTEPLIQLNKMKQYLKSNINSLLHVWLENSVTDLERFESYRGIAFIRDLEGEEDCSQTILEKDYQTFHDEFLTDKTWFSEKMAGYELRQGQLEMMEFVNESFQDSEFGLIEAGTGTGKTLAYLIPSAFRSIETGKPVVISTYTTQLQEQLAKKEVPTLKMLLPFPISTAVLKGRSHYICLKKFEDLLLYDSIESYERTIAKAQILIWLTETETGDVEELNLAGKSRKFWSEVASDALTCTSPKCPWFFKCFYQRARKKAKGANILITNHSLILSEIMANHQAIPNYKDIVIDEAHHLEDTATEQFGHYLDYLSLTHLLNELGLKDSDGLLDHLTKFFTDSDESLVKEVEDNSKELKQEWSDLFLLLHQYIVKANGSQNETGRITATIDSNSSNWHNVKEAIDRCSYYMELWITSVRNLNTVVDSFKDNARSDNLSKYLDRANDVIEVFHSLLVRPDDEMIYWLEAETKGPKHSVFVQGKPIHVSDILADKFFNKKHSVVLTSATLSVNNKFDYIMQRFGLEDFPVKTKIVDSPFQWKSQAQLMIPTDMPLINDVGEQAYIESVVLQLYRIAEVTKGKMLVLFTSYDMLKRSYYLLKEIISEEYVLIAQGVQTGSRTKLTKNFQQFEKSILLGTSSFWEGVDIPGKDLSAIVIVRLPFTPPNDPIYKAKAEALNQEGKNPFMKLALPQAIIRFKQGFGRLIRTSHDKGVVIVLDRRIVTTRYGKAFIKSLPPVNVVEDSMEKLEMNLINWL
ncbi:MULTISPECIES: ATP-dependent DNA helicase DinG [Bacillaceae]|uniref:3'-5' exonuclease DinG n=1 Tax=Evansella alkalicola TaxID=745819 RepID=A0ABS6K1V6_9BACI|nr:MULTISPECIES: ATP-dependent DNA helicase DinG [Bacillaceae]MBU9723914.1 ATP-dependent DNA helicase DinG [Bacillus alkalicola]